MMDSKEAIKWIESEILGCCTEELIDYMQLVSADKLYDLKKLITRQDKMIELAVEYIAPVRCPFEHEPCPEHTTEVGCHECWRKYLQSEVSK